MKSGIYCIENTLTGLVYVGCAINFRSRETTHRRHLVRGDHHNRFLQRAWSKYGPSAFVFRVIDVVENPEHLLDREAFWIDSLRSAERRFGYNLCRRAASRLGVKNSPEQNAKIGDANRGIKRSDEFCRRMSVARRGKKLGPRPPEVVERYAAAQRGKKRRPLTAEHRAKIVAANAGRALAPLREFLTDDHKAAISRGLTGRKRKPFSPEHKARLAEATREHYRRKAAADLPK